MEIFAAERDLPTTCVVALLLENKEVGHFPSQCGNVGR